ncbi:hypothetical protein HPP92_012283 [Vanilla planifolia]|uniref:non-specific serine/threonine protein kinase n=1 Tax=Vanilla planifolia TaxID=51239 RepID=A0A835UVN9_VANPL|nr:hypothetical protein HPP92_012283 [Vanilla planifolia]
MCLSDCRCQGFSYQSGTGLCYGKTVLYNGRTTPLIHVYIKVPKSSANIKSAKPDVHGLICNSTKVVSVVGSSEMLGKTSESIIWVYIYSCLAAIFVVEALFIAIGWCLLNKKGDDELLLAQGYNVISSQFRRFSYTELKKATRNFKEELGRGGTGVVYKGSMENGILVAVKKLEEVIQGEEEFWGEVSIIGRIYHMNLVRTWGFCFEGSHKLLVCEYVHNGSLDKALFDENNTLLEWKERFKIAIGVARGLAYLHHECLEWVIHCDVKPENILLDSNYEPKIADFGLSKLLNRGGIESNLSRIRGTRGYIAPEWASNFPITGKIDVYSYGIVLLELISGTRISGLAMQELKQSETMATKRLCVVVKENLDRDGEAWVEEFVDSRLKGEFASKEAMRMVKVAICCLEEERNRRPTMEVVVQMLLCHEKDLSSHITKSQEF